MYEAGPNARIISPTILEDGPVYDLVARSTLFRRGLKRPQRELIGSILMDPYRFFRGIACFDEGTFGKIFPFSPDKALGLPKLAVEVGHIPFHWFMVNAGMKISLESRGVKLDVGFREPLVATAPDYYGYHNPDPGAQRGDVAVMSFAEGGHPGPSSKAQSLRDLAILGTVQSSMPNWQLEFLEVDSRPPNVVIDPQGMKATVLDVGNLPEVREQI